MLVADALYSLACSFALPNAGSNIEAKMAIMAMTTSNSISVNADFANAVPLDRILGVILNALSLCLALTTGRWVERSPTFGPLH